MKRSATRTEDVYRQLRAAILEGRLLPGQRLHFASLSEAYGASVGVLREALTRLAAEGLAVNQAQHGFRVIDLSTADLEDLTETRCLIEGLVLKDSVRNGSLEWESQVVAAHYRLERTPQQRPDDPAPVTAEWAQAHHDFHMALLAGATSRRMADIAASLRAAAEIYRRWSIPFEETERDVAAEHQRIVDAALARDSEAAEQALTEHLRLTKRLILDGVGAEGGTDTRSSGPVGVTNGREGTR